MTATLLREGLRTAVRLTALLGASIATISCSGSNSPSNLPPETTVQPELLSMHHGRLVDVYGLRPTDDGTVISLYERDVMIGPNIADQRPSNSSLSDNEITYDFISSDPDTLQPRLLIPRPLDSQGFVAAFEALDEQVRSVTAMRYDQGDIGLPFSVVPRNAAIRLNFSASLEVDDSFFVRRNEESQVAGLINTEAVQLLRIVGDPEGEDGFVPQPVRIVARDRNLILDPVLLGSEGVQYQTSNNPSGMPASADQTNANIRIAIALEGPLAIPGLRESQDRGITGKNNRGSNSIVRDFRSGNADDTSSDLSRGFVRDTLPLRIVGSIPMYLERVDEINAFTQEVTIYKNGISHEIDRGDVLRFARPGSGEVFGTAEVVVDPADDLDSPDTQHVRVRIRRIDNLASIDPRNIPGYPDLIGEREPWLVANAPIAVCLAEFTAGGIDGRDEPRNFLTFTPEPLELGDYRPQANEFVSPFADAIVRFTKPVDLDTVKWADTVFFAMRNLTSETQRQNFIDSRPNNAGGVGMDPATFSEAKYRSPFLITSRVIDEDGSQTQLRLQATSGFYLDERMRTAPVEDDYRYFLHIIANSDDEGVRDLAGNPLDLQGTTAASSNSIVMDFTLDTRKVDNEPVFPDNLSVSIVRRYAERDEDENPSLFLASEVRAANGEATARTRPLDDLFGAVLYLDGRLQARPTSRSRAIADNFNQLPAAESPEAPAPQNPLSWCPQTVSAPQGGVLTDWARASNSAATAFGAPIQNPLNPFGCRLQTLWREVDMSLSRDNPFDFNVDIEQMYWSPFQAGQLFFDEFDRTSLVLGHSEYRPTPCVGDFSSLPSLPESGLRGTFEDNYLSNQRPIGDGGTDESTAPRANPYTLARLPINPSLAITAENGGNRFMPLPQFQEPYFVWRDETVAEQGGDSGLGSDLTGNLGGPVIRAYAPYILSPFAMGQSGRTVDGDNQIEIVRSYWNDATNYQLNNQNTRDRYTGGLLGSIALPLLADFQTLYDSGELPAENPFFAVGSNGLQVSATVTSDPRPRFRVFSAGRPGAAPQGELAMRPSDPGWSEAVGGWALVPNNPTAPWTITPPSPPSLAPLPPGPDIKGDNTLYWVMMELLKRQSVATSGFIDINNPHRVPEGFADARLGPYFLQGGATTQPDDVSTTFATSFDPPLSRLPDGTSLVPQFRGASAVDASPWYWERWISQPSSLWPVPSDANPSLTAQNRVDLRPTAENFALDPTKAGDAHIRKWDTRPLPSGSPRNSWTYLYNRTVTSYVEDPNELMDPAFADQYSTATEPFAPNDIRYVNWRFIMRNNANAQPPIDPSIETFALSYRFGPR